MNLKKYFNNPSLILLKLDRMGIRLLSDEKFVKIVYKNYFNKELNLEEPKTFNEKIQWLKLNDRKDIYTTMVDKYEAKEYVANIIGKEYIIPTLGIYNKFSDIDFNELPEQFVIKCTHDSGSIIVVKDKKNINTKEMKRKINKSLRKNFYYRYREWPYKNIKPRIIVEKYMEDKKYHELRDYKVYAFNGRCDYLMLCFDRNSDETKFVFFDRDWNIKKEFTNAGIKYGDKLCITKPKTVDKMFEFASILSKNIPFVRVDFYEVNGKCYFGELTFYPSSGFDTNRRKESDEFFSSQLIINKNKGEINERIGIYKKS
ncbi:MAG: glycosyl transferase [Bacilli bacterium]|nr:glycosyl transferase [Bacilli bacterium]